MNKFSKDLIQGMEEACRFVEGKRKGSRIHKVDVPDIRALRRRLHMSQHQFADAYRIPLATLKNWEQSRRAPDAPAAAYLTVIAANPKAVEKTLVGSSA